MKQSIWDGVSLKKPSAFIANEFKQRLKQFGNTVYLKDSDTFTIELYNPKHIHILAQIKINGQYISGGGIVLRPAERIFLERFLDSNNKFVFHTYEVDSTVEAFIAISENGNVQIEFFDEYVPTSNPYVGAITYTNYPIYTTNTGGFIGGVASFTTTNDCHINSIKNNTLSSNSLLCDSKTFFNKDLRSAPSTPKVETGIIDKGEKSDQHFVNSNRSFLHHTDSIVTWKILPMSQKVYQSDDIKNYCTECGAKVKKASYKFCPHCGTKY